MKLSSDGKKKFKLELYDYTSQGWKLVESFYWGFFPMTWEVPVTMDKSDIYEKGSLENDFIVKKTVIIGRYYLKM